MKRWYIGLGAFATLLSFHLDARATCTEGMKQDCISASGCPGEKECILGFDWGTCEYIPGAKISCTAPTATCGNTAGTRTCDEYGNAGACTATQSFCNTNDCDAVNYAELSSLANRIEDHFNPYGGTQLAVVRKQSNGQLCTVTRNHGFAVSAWDVYNHSTAISTMTYDIPMNIWSVSKALTGARMAEVLAALQISPQAAIGPYIPSWLSPGPGVEKITFEELLEHKSGMPQPAGDCNVPSVFHDWLEEGCEIHFITQECLNNGTDEYNSMTYVLLQVLIANMTTNLSQEMTNYGKSDAWTAGKLLDLHVRGSYFMGEAAYSGCTHTLSHSPFAYPPNATSTTAGYQYGTDFNTGCGTGGFALTAYDLAKTFSLLYAGDIMQQEAVDMVFDSGYGMDWAGTTIGGTPFVMKGGGFETSGTEQQSILFVFKDHPGTVVVQNTNIHSDDNVGMLVNAWDEARLCDNGVPAEALGNQMWGCPGSESYANKATLCGSETHVCTPAEWEARRFSGAAGTPDHIYWTDYGSTELGYSGSSSNCSARYVNASPAGTTCGSSGNAPMRICSGTSDAEGNACNWTGCKYESSTNTNYWGGCLGNTTAGALCCANRPCADGTAEQSWGTNMYGCAGSVSYANRESLCGHRMHVCTAEEWNAKRASTAPTHIYWTDNGASDLGFSGSGSNNCAAKAYPSTGTTSCGTLDSNGDSTRPMRVCSGTSDAEGNTCTWTGCKYESETAANYLGGCVGNANAGALCCPD
ncbi:serine hydrolase [Polyangium sorediatum]|uniref:Serine hydrolase n=1 Tax=Polyangium sorediatum TaxID=889274 RepID=A0ABT6P6E9_9BACT|nr:serine hydrolase [Polyangium sorediatum]MDI1436148.1 serine hydrolase [Polyangium sorediatum]